MEYNKVVSVIIPIYNVEKYIVKCVQSVINQSYKQLEILLIDDGSTDSSGEICDTLLVEDSRIKVFHKENGGLSSARNYGIEQATGDYITFIDSDDYVHINFIESLLDLIIQFESELSFLEMGLVDEFGNFLKKPISKVERGSLDTSQALWEMCLNKKTGVSACSKLYKRELFDQIRFPEGKIFEDIATIPYVMANAKRVSFSTDRMYYYVQRAGSITHSPIVSKDYTIFEAFDKLLLFINKRYPSIEEAAIVRVVNDTFWRFMQRLIYNKDYLIKAKAIKKKYKKIWIKSLKYKHLGLGKKIQIIMALVNLRLYQIFRIFYNLKE